MKFFAAFLLVATVAIGAHAGGTNGNHDKPSRLFVSHFENVLGTSLELKVRAASEKQAAVAESMALKEIDRLDKILSGYDAASEFSKWLRTSNRPVHVSAELFEVLSLFDKWRGNTNGALDASAQVVGKMWKEAASKNIVPSAEEISAAVKEVKQQHWLLDAHEQTATHLTNAPLMLNSFAKSYIIQHAANAALAAGDVNAVVVNIGGDLVIAGDAKENVQISDPRADAENDAAIDQLVVSNKAVATSGNYRRGEKINGTWYSHIVDPRTGMPAGEVISATVVSPSATDAGAIATAMNVLSVDESRKLAASVPGTEFMLITRNGKRVQSEGWAALETHRDHVVAAKPAADPWSDRELLIEFELAHFEGMTRRPYVVVWVEDREKNPVRTISLWYQKDRWLRDLRLWFTTNGSHFTGEENKANMSSISSATRSPGKYSVKWDGKDDKGNYVKPGRYTVYIEAAREHGTYQIISQEMNFSGTPAHVTAPGNVEIASASFDYRKKN